MGGDGAEWYFGLADSAGVFGVGAGQVDGGDAHEEGAVGLFERGFDGGAGGAGAGGPVGAYVVEGVGGGVADQAGGGGADAAEEFAEHIASGGGVVAEELPGGGVGDEVVAKDAGCAEESEESDAEYGVGADGVVDVIVVALVVVESDHKSVEGVEGQVGVSRPGERPEDFHAGTIPPAKPGEVADGSGAGEAEGSGGGDVAAGGARGGHAFSF